MKVLHNNAERIQGNQEILSGQKTNLKIVNLQQKSFLINGKTKNVLRLSFGEAVLGKIR